VSFDHPLLCLQSPSDAIDAQKLMNYITNWSCCFRQAKALEDTELEMIKLSAHSLSVRPHHRPPHGTHIEPLEPLVDSPDSCLK
jgi:hypothetical protein